jgi:hypothetical protein
VAIDVVNVSINIIMACLVQSVGGMRIRGITSVCVLLTDVTLTFADINRMCGASVEKVI